MLLEAKTNCSLSVKESKIRKNAEGGITKSISKKYVSKVVKDLCASDVRGIAVAVLDTIFGDLQEEDCQLGARAICFRSNKSFAQRLNVDETTIQRALKNLARCGVLTFRYSPNGKRFYNKKTGEKFGIDLTPAWNNFEAFKAELEARQQAKARQQRLQAAVKTSRKTQLHTVLKLLEQAKAAGKQEHVRLLEQLKGQIEKINQSTMTYNQRLDALEIIAGKLQEIAVKIEPEKEEVPALTRSSTGAYAVHQYNTSLIPLNKFCGLALEDERDLKQRLKPDFPTCKARVDRFDHSVFSAKTKTIIGNSSKGQNKPDFVSIDLELVHQALPKVIQSFGFTWRNWCDVKADIFALKRGLGLSDDALQEGLERHEPAFVGIAMAIVLELVLQDRDITNPGGYVRWLFRRKGPADAVLMPLLFDLITAQEPVC